MKMKIVRFFAVILFSSAFLLLLGSLPLSRKKPEKQESYELQKINKSANNALTSDFSMLQQKNPLILLEFSVE